MELGAVAVRGRLRHGSYTGGAFGITGDSRMRYIRGKAKVSAKGWIVVPKEMRDEMGLQPGDEVNLSLLPPGPHMKQDSRLYTLRVSRAPKDTAEAIDISLGMFIRQPGEPLMTEELLKDRARERELEDRDPFARPKKRRRTSA